MRPQFAGPAVQDTPATAASNGASPWASSPAITPASTSPVPAVASGRRGRRVHLHPAIRRGDDRVRAFEHHDLLPVLRGGALRDAHAVGLHRSRRSTASRRAISPGCGVRIAVGGQAVGPALDLAEQVQPVGVDHQRRQRARAFGLFSGFRRVALSAGGAAPKPTPLRRWRARLGGAHGEPTELEQQARRVAESHS